MRSLMTLAERNQVVVAYMPLALRIARAFWGRHMALSGKKGHTQKRNSDAVTYDDLQSAGYRALVQARDGWDPLLSNCNQPDCYLPSDNGKFPKGISTVKQLLESGVTYERCPHGNAGYTFGAFAQRFIEGACIAALKKSHRRKPLPYTEELMAISCVTDRDRAERPDSRANEYERLPDYHHLQDGSEFDGSPSAAWSSVDMLALRKFIADAIESGDLLVRGLSADQLRIIIANIGDGRSHAEVAGDACCKVSHVHAALSTLRALLVETDYADDEHDSPQSLSLSELAAQITKVYPHDPCIPKRLGEWLMRGWVPGKQNADGRWFISRWGAKIAIKKWGERKSRGSKELDTDPTSDKVQDMSRSKPARTLRVIGHVGTALPEYSGAVIGPVVSIEVGQGRAQSCAVTSAGDKFYGRNREAVLQRFGLVQEGEDVRPGAQVPVPSPVSAPSGPPTPSAGAAANPAAPLNSASANVS